MNHLGKAKSSLFDDDDPFSVLTETKFSIRYIPVWTRYSPLRTRVEDVEPPGKGEELSSCYSSSSFLPLLLFHSSIESCDFELRVLGLHVDEKLYVYV